MAADRESSFRLTFDGSDNTLRSFVAQMKSQLRSDVADLEAITGRVELFKGAQDKLAQTEAAGRKATQALVEIGQKIDLVAASGGKVDDALTKAFNAATKSAQQVNKEYERNATSLAKLDAQLKAAGVDTSKLAAEEIRLAAALQQANAAATNQAAQQALGLKTIRDIAPELARLNAAYNTLRASGTLTSNELTQAQIQLRNRIKELRDSVSGAGVAAKTASSEVTAFFQRSILPALGLAAAGYKVVEALKASIAASKEFQQGVAEIGSITNLSRKQLDDLGAGARALAADLGLDLTATLKGLFDLIRSGVAPDNALAVLKVSAEAAKAGVTDLASGVKAANLLLDSFGADVSELPLLFDKINRGAKDGGATLKEFADSGGPLLNLARAANISFDELLAVLTVMVDKSGDVEKSFGDLGKIIAKLDTAEARQKLRDLNIEGGGLIDTFRQIGERGLSLEDVLGTGLSGSGAKGAASIATLTTNSKALSEELDRLKGAGGDTQKAITSLLDSPKERGERFNAALHEAEVNIGELFGSGSRFAIIGTKLLGVFNGLAKTSTAAGGAMLSFDIRANQAAVAGTFMDNSLSRALTTFFGYPPVVKEAAASLDGMTEAQKRTKEQAEATAKAVKDAKQALGDFSTQLTADVQALQQASARDIADINARADAQIAALDRSRTALAATSAATLTIQLQAAADRQAVIEKSEADITKAVDLANQAREKIARANGTTETKIAADSASARIAALAPVLAQYQQHYAALIALSQTYADKARSAEQARVDIAKSVTEEIRQVRLSELDDLDQFAAKQAHIDELISQGRLKAAQGDIEAAKSYFDQAINESKGLTAVIDQNGVAVITQLQAREARLGALKKISDAANQSIGEQGNAAAASANEAIKAADSVAVKIRDLQKTYDDLKKTAAEGLALKVNVDETSIANAVRTLDELTKPRTIDVTVRVNSSGLPAPGVPVDGVGPPSPGFSEGGPVQRFAAGGKAIRLPAPFARGGPVFFRGPTTAFARGGPVVPTAAPITRTVVQYVHQRFATGGPVARRMATWTKAPAAPVAAPIPQRFALGGPVFRGPKVPGIGDGDTVPARLQAGSFVVRKSASQFYGDTVMHRIAHFALGGPVSFSATGGTRSVVFNPAAIAQQVPAVAATGDTETPENVIQYAQAVLALYGRGSGYKLLRSMAPVMQREIEILRTNPGDKVTLDLLLKQADYLGRNNALIDYVDRTTSPGGPLASPFTFDDFVKTRAAAKDQVQRFAVGGAVARQQGAVAGRAAFGAGASVSGRAANGTTAPKGGSNPPALPIQRFALGGYTSNFFTAKQNTFVYKDPYLGNIYQNAAGEQVFNQNAAGADDHVYIGDIKSGSAESSRNVAEISFPDLPNDPKERIRVVLDYVQAVKTAALSTDNYFFWAKSFDALARDLRQYENNPSDSNLMVVLRRARGIGLNLGLSKRDHLGFDVDGRKWHKTYGTDSFNAPGLAGLGNTYDFYASGGPAPRPARATGPDSRASRQTAPASFYAGGGPASDTIPALLTPGEFVMRAPIVSRVAQRFGADFLPAINEMRMSPTALDALLQPPARTVRHFAEGGLVSYESGALPALGGGSLPALTPGGELRNLNVTVNAAPGALLSRDNVLRYIVPHLEDFMKNARR